MKKIALLAVLSLLMTAVLNCGIAGLSGVAQAAPGDAVIFSDPNFEQALKNQGVDANADETITQEEMAALTDLTIFEAGITDISGIEYAVNLTSLSIFNNNLTALPSSIGNLTKLTYLDLHRNNLTSLPDSICNLTNLTELYLWDNLLTALPAGFVQFKSITTLDITYNYLNIQDLSGSGYSAVSYDPQYMYTVSLNYNGGSGDPLPQTYYCRNDAVTLPAAAKAGMIFFGWDLNGDNKPEYAAGDSVTIAPTPITTKSLTFKAIYGYTVTFQTQRFGTINGGSADVAVKVPEGERVGSVPAALANDGYLLLGWFDGTTLVTAEDIVATDINANRTFTAIYEAIGTIHFADGAFYAALIAAGVDANDDGFITESEMAALTSLDLHGVQLADIREIGQATGLTALNLSSCSLAALPDELCNLANLRELDVSGNPITALPANFANLINLETLDISGCSFDGVPERIGNLSALKTLNMGSLQLIVLPGWLLTNTGVKSLGLSDNLFAGLPGGYFAGMTGLTSLDLSGNYLNPNGLPEGFPAFADTSNQHTYTVTLELRGGTLETPPERTEYYYGELIQLPSPSMDGSEFQGWDDDGDGEWDIFGAGTTSLQPCPPDSVDGQTFTAVFVSHDASLADIGLSEGAYIDPVFNPETGFYTVMLYDYVQDVTISPLVANAKASMLIDGNSVSSVSVQLPNTTDTKDVVVDVTAEDGTTHGFYTLHVCRAQSIDLSLKAIRLSSGVKNSPAFSSGVTAYTVLMPATVSSVTIYVDQVNANSTVTIDGVPGTSNTVSVGLGLSRDVKIVISSDKTTDKTKTYTLTLKRATTLSGFTAYPKVGYTPMLSPGGTNRMTFSYNMGGPGTVTLAIYRSGRWYTILSRTETSAGPKSWAWDGKISGRYLYVGTYTARITQQAFGMSGTANSTSFKIVGSPYVTWRSYARTFRAIGSTYTLCSFKVNYPTNAVVQVYNSRGRVVATVASYTNMPPSRYYAAYWNGRASTGNTAGLAAGSLVPTGTYTVRITAGARYTYRTIKITR